MAVGGPQDHWIAPHPWRPSTAIRSGRGRRTCRTYSVSVTASWRGECRRCGGPVHGAVVAEVRERYAPTGGTDRDEEAYPLTGDELDLEPLARDAVLLDLPLAPLCLEECAGLCPTCGANRNTESCDCTPAVDPRWAALDTLRDGGAQT